MKITDERVLDAIEKRCGEDWEKAFMENMKSVLDGDED